MYKVVRSFKDKDGHIYKIGDSYPTNDTKNPTAARIKALSTKGNKYKQIYIEKTE